MPALTPTSFSGKITWLGSVPNRATPEIETNALQDMPLTFAGAKNEVHAGLTRPSCSRVLSQYPRDTEIRNTRQISIVCATELAKIAATLGLDAIDPAWLGASIVVDGIPDFSHVPPSSRLQSQDGVTLTVDMQNRPCIFPAKTIEAAKPGHGKAFKAAAAGMRGVTAWVEREGTLRLGDTLTLHVPDQRAWMAQPDLFEG
ncbi:MOSC domain-containing protein [Loktanella sp. F6476L]|uniref:MOSC domain-containing protein n=1 Tax=Loktanella sp. F6476L TaxID=2926405 RepID=UPI001FF2A246|nr:MOSC domain-containing protein [Loktanella sp. F6476L]MCK0120160.1 MOSC domain-containing protein [Loktanella sp. F6476L]